MLGKKWSVLALLVLLSAMVLSACEGETKEVVVTQVVTEKETVVETVVQKETVVETVIETVVEKETVIETVVVQATAEPTETGPRTLVICLGQEPDTLYPYGGSMLTDLHVQQAIWDGPIDNRTFSYQAVILEKIPSLADGDAVVNTVTAETGDLVVNNEGNPVTLEEGVVIRAAGCHSADCAAAFDGNPVEMEQMVVTFKLLEGILWSDSEPVTAYDSVYAWELRQDPDTPATKYTIDRTVSYEALDDTTVVWTGLPGYRDSLYMTNFEPPLPEHAWGGMTALELIQAEESSRKPIGWGPYVIDEWVAGDHITLGKNPLYFRADEGLPKFEKIVFRVVGENSNANIAAVLSGECDIVDQSSHLDDQSQLLLELQAAGQVQATFVTGTAWEHTDFGIDPWITYERPDYFEDVRTRRAIAYCLDRQAVVDTVVYGQSVVIDTYVPPEHPLFNPDVMHYEYDPEQAIALLEEVGWMDDDGDPATPRVAQGVEGVPDGTPFEVNYITTSATQRQQATQIFQADLAECGIQVNLEYWNATDYFADGPEGPIFGRLFDIGQFTYLSGIEPPCHYYTTQQLTGPADEGFCGWGCANNPGFSNAEYDLACNTAIQSLPGTPEYEQYHKEAQRLFAENLPVIPLYLKVKLAAARSDMKGFIMDPTANSEFWNIENFDYGE